MVLTLEHRMHLGGSFEGDALVGFVDAKLVVAAALEAVAEVRETAEVDRVAEMAAFMDLVAAFETSLVVMFESMRWF